MITIEPLEPLTVKVGGGLRQLTPGIPVELSEDQGRRLLAKAGCKVRVVKPDWVRAWREVAALTVGVEESPADPRFTPVMTALDACDRAFERDDWPGFHREAAWVRAIVEGGLGR